MSKSSISKINLKSFDDLFGGDEGANTVSGEIREIPLSCLHEFKNHPFRLNDEKIAELADSIREHGVLIPGIARMCANGGYEIIAGHTRAAACKLAGLNTMPMFIRNLSDDEATVVMVDSNIQREDILPSERAKAYSMRYYAMKHQGRKGQTGNSLDAMSEETGENVKKIQRYIRLARLSDELLAMVDSKKLSFTCGLDISFLSAVNQRQVYNIIAGGQTISSEQSSRLKAMSQEKLSNLTGAEIANVLQPRKPQMTARKVTFKADRLNKYFDEGYTDEKIAEIIYSLLDEWKRKGEKV